MDIDVKTKSALENLIFYGIVSSQDPAKGTVRVIREDKENKVTAELMVLQRGTKDTKDFWIPAIGDQVLCIQTPNFSGKGVGDGFVLGAFYSTRDVPVEDDVATQSIHFPDGSYVQYKDGNINIHAAGDVNITSGGHINLN